MFFSLMSQYFGRICHMLYKIKQYHSYYFLFKSYLSERYFHINQIGANLCNFQKIMY